MLEIKIELSFSFSFSDFGMQAAAVSRVQKFR